MKRFRYILSVCTILFLLLGMLPGLLTATATEPPKVLSSALYAVLGRQNAQYLYQNRFLTGSSAALTTENQRAWWYLEETTVGYMLKNYASGEYVSTENNFNYFECLPLNVDYLESYLFSLTVNDEGYALLRNKSSGFLINTKALLGWAENTNVGGDDYSTQFTLIPLEQDAVPESLTNDFSASLDIAVNDTPITVMSDNNGNALIRDHHNHYYLYETTTLPGDLTGRAVVGLKQNMSFANLEALWSIVRTGNETVMFKNCLSGNYITNINGNDYYEVLPLPEDENDLVYYTFKMDSGKVGTLFYNVATDKLLHTEGGMKYARTDDEGVLISFHSAQFVFIGVDEELQWLEDVISMYENTATIPAALPVGTDVTSLVVKTKSSISSNIPLSMSVEPGVYLEVQDDAILLSAKNTTEGIAIETVTLTIADATGSMLEKHISVAIQTEFTDESTSKRILIFSPHPDDDILGTAGIINQAITDEKEVFVAFVTNGDAYRTRERGITRIGELARALELLGVDTAESVIIMGYGDAALDSLYTGSSPDMVMTSSAGESTTYGSEEYPDYHSIRFGSPAPYNRNSIVQDFDTILNELRPDEIYTTSIYDTHWDHYSTGLFVTESLVKLKQMDPTYSPRLFSTIIHESDEYWPVRQTIIDNFLEEIIPFSKPASLEIMSPLEWNRRISIPVPNSMKLLSMSANLKYQAIRLHDSQLGGAPFLYSFVKSDEFFWLTDFSNIAYLADITASSALSSQRADAVADGIFDGKPRNHYSSKEWVTNRETTGAWIQLSWDREYTIDRIRLYDRINLNDNLLSATLTFSDGSSITVDALPPEGLMKEIVFERKNVSWIRLTIDTVDTETTAIGLAEFEVFEPMLSLVGASYNANDKQISYAAKLSGPVWPGATMVTTLYDAAMNMKDCNIEYVTADNPIAQKTLENMQGDDIVRLLLWRNTKSMEPLMVPYKLTIDDINTIPDISNLH